MKIIGRESLSIMRRRKTLSKSQRPESGRTTLLELIRSLTIIPHSIIIDTVKYKLYYIKDTTKKIRRFFPRNEIYAKNYFFKYFNYLRTKHIFSGKMTIVKKIFLRE